MAKKKSESQAVDTATSQSTMTTPETCAVDKRVVCNGQKEETGVKTGQEKDDKTMSSSRKDSLVFIDYESLPVFDPGSEEYIGKEDEVEEDDDVETDY